MDARQFVPSARFPQQRQAFAGAPGLRHSSAHGFAAPPFITSTLVLCPAGAQSRSRNIGEELCTRACKPRVRQPTERRRLNSKKPALHKTALMTAKKRVPWKLLRVPSRSGRNTLAPAFLTSAPNDPSDQSAKNSRRVWHPPQGAIFSRQREIPFPVFQRGAAVSRFELPRE